MGLSKNITDVVQAFFAGKRLTRSSCRTDGNIIFSYATPIIWKDAQGNIVAVDERLVTNGKTKKHLQDCQTAMREAASNGS